MKYIMKWARNKTKLVVIGQNEDINKSVDGIFIKQIYSYKNMGVEIQTKGMQKK